jgi:hypothetical protein
MTDVSYHACAMTHIGVGWRLCWVATCKRRCLAQACRNVAFVYCHALHNRSCHASLWCEHAVMEPDDARLRYQ